MRFLVFFFKQKTAYEMRISDWSSDVCSSDLLVGLGLWVRLKLTETPAFAEAKAKAPPPRVPFASLFRHHMRATLAGTFAVVTCFAIFYIEIGRASCRERVCQYV